MKYTIITIGKTHSGKTTFGKDIKQRFSDIIFFDADILGDFFKIHYPWMYNQELLPLNEEGMTAGKSLEIVTRLEILEKASQTKYPLLISASHASSETRKTMLELAHTYNRNLILVFFNYSEEFLLERIKNSGRDRVSLTESKTYENLLLNKQKQIFETPTADEADIFFEITDNESLECTKQQILNLISSSL